MPTAAAAESTGAEVPVVPDQAPAGTELAEHRPLAEEVLERTLRRQEAHVRAARMNRYSEFSINASPLRCTTSTSTMCETSTFCSSTTR
jgi:hypothetical protein